MDEPTTDEMRKENYLGFAAFNSEEYKLRSRAYEGLQPRHFYDLHCIQVMQLKVLMEIKELLAGKS